MIRFNGLVVPVSVSVVVICLYGTQIINQKSGLGLNENIFINYKIFWCKPPTPLPLFAAIRLLESHTHTNISILDNQNIPSSMIRNECQMKMQSSKVSRIIIKRKKKRSNEWIYKKARIGKQKYKVCL